MPVTAYHVDRKELLHEGQTVNLVQTNRFPKGDPADMWDSFATIFPSGLSKHGLNYFTFNGKHSTESLLCIGELFYEYIRLLRYPDLPARIKSFYAFEDLETAKIFAKENKAHRIFEVSADSYFRADMNLMYLKGVNPNTGISLPMMFYSADKYWRGEMSDEPKIELLLVPPVKIIRFV